MYSYCYPCKLAQSPSLRIHQQDCERTDAMVFILCYILSCMSILAYESLQERRKENSTFIFYWKMKGATLHWYVSPNWTHRQTHGAGQPSLAEGTTNFGIHWDHVKLINSMSQVQSCLCRFKECFTVAARAAAPGAREPACEKHAQ